MRVSRSARAVVWILLGFSAFVAAFAGYLLIESEREHAEAGKSYESLATQIKQKPRLTPGVASSIAPEATARLPQAEIPDIGIDAAALDAVGEACVAWLYCPDTVIDYPVMFADNYDYYLKRLPDGTKNKNGSLFLDYNCKPDFSDTMSIIYGHHMKSGMMFGTLSGYKKQDYYDVHPHMYLYTRAGNYRIDLLCGAVIAAGAWKKNAYMFQENSMALLSYITRNSTFEPAVPRSAARADMGRYVAMSTCSYEFNDARYVVLGALVPEFPS